MIGVELVENKETKKPLPLPRVLDIFEDIKDTGLLIGRGGHYGNVRMQIKIHSEFHKGNSLVSISTTAISVVQVFRLAPPMCLTKADVDFALPLLRKVFQKHSS